MQRKGRATTDIYADRVFLFKKEEDSLLVLDNDRYVIARTWSALLMVQQLDRTEFMIYSRTRRKHGRALIGEHIRIRGFKTSSFALFPSGRSSGAIRSTATAKTATTRLSSDP